MTVASTYASTDQVQLQETREKGGLQHSWLEARHECKLEWRNHRGITEESQRTVGTNFIPMRAFS